MGNQILNEQKALARLQELMRSEHWLAAYVSDLLSAHNLSAGIDFRTAQQLLSAEREQFEEDLVIARRMLRLYGKHGWYPSGNENLRRLPFIVPHPVPSGTVDTNVPSLVGPSSPVPGPRVETADVMEKLRKKATRIKIHPIIPARCAQDEFTVGEVGFGTVQFDKLGSGHRITIPSTRIKEALPMDQDERSAIVVLAGRLQWISMSQSWRFFPEAPLPGANPQIGLGKPSWAEDRRRVDIESKLKSRGRSVWLVDERHLPAALSQGRQVIYDEDGKYFRVPSGPNLLILIATGS